MTPALQTEPTLDVTVEGSIAEIRINRPEIRNALDHATLAAFSAAIGDLDADPAVKVVMLHGAGRSFCSGFELSSHGDAISAVALDAEADHRRVSGYLEVVEQLTRSRLIVIGAVHGHCLGIGVLFSAACDLLVVEEDSRFGMPVIPIGAAFVSAILATVVGVRRAKRMSLVPGGAISGTTAYEWGLATDLAATGEALPTARALAADVAKMPAAVLRLEKRGMHAAVEATGLQRALAAAADLDAIAHGATEVHALKSTIQRVGLRAAVAELGF